MDKKLRKKTTPQGRKFIYSAIGVATLLVVSLYVAVHWLSGKTHVVVKDGIWTWFNDERALMLDDGILIGYVKSDGKIAATTYDFKSNTSSESVLSSWSEKDDHNNPSFWVRPDGRIIVAYSTHGKRPDWFYRVSKHSKPVSIDDWGDEKKVYLDQFNDFSGGWTYCNLYSTSPYSLYNFGRAIEFNPTYSLSSDGGQAWSRAVHLITHERRPYVKYAATSDRIDVAYTDGHPATTKNSIHHFFVKGDKFYKTDGELIRTLEELPIDVNQGSIVYKYGSMYKNGPAWIWDLNYDEKQNPVVTHSIRLDRKESDIRYFYDTWDSAKMKWFSKEIAQGGECLYSGEKDYAGGIVLDPQDSKVVYISTTIDPSTQIETVHREIYRGILSQNGEFRWTPITQDSKEDNFRPYVPEKHHSKICVLWLQGKYNSYTDFKCRILIYRN